MRLVLRPIMAIILATISVCSFTVLGYRLGNLHAKNAKNAADMNAHATQAGVRQVMSEAQIITMFHALFYKRDPVDENRWLGILTEQNPMDVWVTQEIMYDTKPDFVIECGSHYGGSAVLWATILQQLNPSGRVISIDIVDRMAEARKLPIAKDRVKFLVGSSTDPAIVANVRQLVTGKRVLLILDSLHTKEHVLSELRAYTPLLRIGDYAIVQDTNVNGHPVFLKHNTGPGPYEAVQEFMAGNGSFVVDESRERLLLTFNPKGFLRRVK